MTINIYEAVNTNDLVAAVVGAVRAELAAFKGVVMEGFDRLSAAVTKLDQDIDADITEARNSGDELKKQLAAAVASVASLQTQLTSITSDDEAVKAQLATAQAQVTDLQQQLANADASASSAAAAIVAVDDKVNAAVANLAPPAPAPTPGPTDGSTDGGTSQPVQ